MIPRHTATPPAPPAVPTDPGTPHEVPPVLANLESDARSQEIRADQKAQVTLAFVGVLLVALATLLARPDLAVAVRIAIYLNAALLVPVVRHLLSAVRPRLAGPLDATGWVQLALTGDVAAYDALAASTGPYPVWVTRCVRATVDTCTRAHVRHVAIRRAAGWLYVALAAFAVTLVLVGVVR